MARKRTDDKTIAEKLKISERLRELRIELHGDRGGPELAKAIGIPTRSWYNYEVGVTVPAEVLLRFLAATRAEPRWLLTGEGPKFRAAMEEGEAALPPVEAILAQALRLLSGGEVKITWKAEE